MTTEERTELSRLRSENKRLTIEYEILSKAAARFAELRSWLTCATVSPLILSAGVDLKTISAALGHTTLSTTADIYAHVTPSLQRAAAERLDATLGAAVTKNASR